MTAPVRERPSYIQPSVRLVLLILLVIAAIVLAVLGWVDQSLNPAHTLAAAIICAAVAIAVDRL